MAKRRPGRGADGVNKSAAIRDVFNTHGMSVASKDVISTLAGRGITVSSAHVANERSRLLTKAQRRGRPPASEAAASATAPSTNGRRKKRRGRKPGPKPGRKPGRKPGGAVPQMESTLLEVKRVADMVGGIDQARRALDLLAKLRG